FAPKKKLLSATIKFGFVSLMIYTFVLITAIMVTYMVKFNSASTKGYEVVRLEVDRQKLILKTEQQELMMSEAKSIASLKDRAVIRRMVKSNTPMYMRLDTAMAKAD
ncbi:hypothetical protein KKG46_01175, partial [Patescibacteria group bacterium]|nr:hypothetical protein [Patescibacteria group bacterium]